MFASDIELDFDDDFPFDTFCNKLTSDKGDAAGGQPPPSQPPKAEANPHTRTAERESSLKRAQVQDERPQKKRVSHEALPQRKFPGPAGLLPDKPFTQLSHSTLNIHTLSPQHNHPQHDPQPLYSQSSASVFLHSAYHQLLTDFSLNDPANPLNRYTVDWLKRTALTKGLQGRKVPFLGLVVHAVNHSMPDPVLLLRDPTGEIAGSLHREVWAEMGPKLRPGIALALRQVGVLITGVIRRQIYLNITMKNIVAVYRAEGGDGGVDITTVNRVSQWELLRDVDRWRGPRGASSPGPSGSCVKGGLSSAESMILEEVLSGIDPDEFEN